MTSLLATPDASPAKRPTLHLAFLDGLRGLAALYVMFHHAWLTIWTNPVYFPRGITGLLTTWLSFGQLSVTVFIVLSGFCLMLPVVRAGGELRGGTIGFFKRRVRRIIPPYYFALAFSCLLILTLIGKPTRTHWDISIPHGTHAWIKGMITHLLLIEDFSDAYKINHVFWSVAVEWQIYFLFPLLLFLWRHRGGLFTAGAAIAVSFGLSFLMAAIAGGDIAVPIHSQRLARIILAVSGRSEQVHIHYVGLFALGMLGAQFAFGPAGRNGIAPIRIPWKAFSAVTGATLLWICCMGISFFLRHKFLTDFLAGLTTIGILIPASRGTYDRARAVLSYRPLVWIGTFSYSLYLVHAPLLQVVWQYLIHPLHMGDGPTFALLALLGGPLIVAAAYLFYLVCERPFLNTPPRPLPKPAA